MRIFEVVENGVQWIGCENFGPRESVTPRAIEQFYDSLCGGQRALFERVCAALPCPKACMEHEFASYGWSREMLDSARLFVPAKLERPVPYFEKTWSCFENSFHYAEKYGLLYVEGLAVNPSGIQLHAWNSITGHDVFDYTWPYQHVNKYFGLIFEVEWLKKHWPAPGGILPHLFDEAKEERSKDPAS